MKTLERPKTFNLSDRILLKKINILPQYNRIRFHRSRRRRLDRAREEEEEEGLIFPLSSSHGTHRRSLQPRDDAAPVK